MDWTAEKLDWTIDGVVVRTLTPAMVNGDFYPQTPMAARIGIWAGGDSGNEQGVIGMSLLCGLSRLTITEEYVQ